MLSSAQIKKAAHDCRFSLVGLARAEPLDHAPLERWLASGMAASMEWMHQRTEERLDPRRLLPGCQTVVALACCFATRAHAAPSAIARYARGRDYHATLRDRLRALRRQLQTLSPDVDTYAEVDTGPVMEKVWAERAGLGWIGKSGVLLTRDHGSQVMLAVMLLDQEVDAYDAPHPHLCGRCTACLESCPTGAIVEPQVVDARRCLSFHTIESRAPLPEVLRPQAGSLAFGCDACQTGCPQAQLDHACDDERFLPRPIAQLGLQELARLDPERHKELTQGTAVARAGFDGLRRNALFALAAEGAAETELATRLANDRDPGVREAARWLLRKG